MQLPFGRHQGRDIELVPDHYLFWLLDEKAFTTTVRSCVRSELRRRKNDRHQQHSSHLKDVVRQAFNYFR